MKQSCFPLKCCDKRDMGDKETMHWHLSNMIKDFDIATCKFEDQIYEELF